VQVYIIAVKRGDVKIEIIYTYSKSLYEDLMEVLKWCNPASAILNGINISVGGKEGVTRSGRRFWREVLS